MKIRIFQETLTQTHFKAVLPSFESGWGTEQGATAIQELQAANLR